MQNVRGSPIANLGTVTIAHSEDLLNILPMNPINNYLFKY